MSRQALLNEMYLETLYNVKANIKAKDKVKLKENLILLRKIIQFSTRPTKRMTDLERGLTQVVKMR